MQLPGVESRSGGVLWAQMQISSKMQFFRCSRLCKIEKSAVFELRSNISGRPLGDPKLHAKNSDPQLPGGPGAPGIAKIAPPPGPRGGVGGLGAALLNFVEILFASLWEVRARKGLIVPAGGGTRQQITQK